MPVKDDGQPLQFTVTKEKPKGSLEIGKTSKKQVQKQFLRAKQSLNEWLEDSSAADSGKIDDIRKTIEKLEKLIKNT